MRIPVKGKKTQKTGKPSFSFFTPTSPSTYSSQANEVLKPSDEPIRIKESVRTSPPPEVYRDGFIVGNIPAGEGESLVRNDDGEQITTYENSQGLTAESASNETPKRPDFANGLINFLMDTDKKQQLANMESLITTEPQEESENHINTIENSQHEHHADHDHNENNHHENHQAHHHENHEDHGNHHGDHSLEHHGGHGTHNGDHSSDHHNMDHGNHDHHHGSEHMDHHGHHGNEHHHNHHDHHPPHFDGQVSAIFNKLPEDYLGLESSTTHLSRSEKSFVDINNELGFQIYKLLLEKEEYKSKNLIFSPLSSSTMLAMIFLGARGTTSWEMNGLLKLDEMISFNPHLMYKNVTDTLMENQQDFAIACVKQLWVDEVCKYICMYLYKQ